MLIPNATLERYRRIYGIVGNHSAVEICLWNKRSLRAKGTCYKEVFYGVKAHSCAQMSPAVAWCQENCIYCWRPMEWMHSSKLSYNEVDDPEKIIDETVRVRRRLISGIGGAKDVDRTKFKDAFHSFPKHWAISLAGEPTIYPRLPELIKLLKEKYPAETIFLVTNGQSPEMLKKLAEENALPTQLYISLTAPNEALFIEVNKPSHSASWSKLMESIGLIKSMNCRTVIRITLLKGINDSNTNIEEFAKLIDSASPDFVEVKAYMWLGLSRKRLKIENMPMHSYVSQWALKLAESSNLFNVSSEHAPSRVALLMNKNTPYTMKIRDSAC